MRLVHRLNHRYRPRLRDNSLLNAWIVQPLSFGTDDQRIFDVISLRRTILSADLVAVVVAPVSHGIQLLNIKDRLGFLEGPRLRFS